MIQYAHDVHRLPPAYNVVGFERRAAPPSTCINVGFAVGAGEETAIHLRTRASHCPQCEPCFGTTLLLRRLLSRQAAVALALLLGFPLSQHRDHPLFPLQPL